VNQEGQVGLQIRWDRMGLGQGGLPAESVYLSQSGTTRPCKFQDNLEISFMDTNGDLEIMSHVGH